MASGAGTAALQVHLNPSDVTRCRVVTPAGEAFNANPIEVGMMILQAASGGQAQRGERDGRTIVARTLAWNDMLGSHGVAIGVGGETHLTTLLKLPALTRTVRLMGQAGRDNVTVTFPPMLAGATFVNRIMTRSGLAMIKPDLPEAQLHVASTAPALCAFPYGNVYSSERGYTICWGEVRTQGVRDIKAMVETFLGSGFNTDLRSDAVARMNLTQARARQVEQGESAGPIVLPAIEAANFRGTIDSFVRALAQE